MAFSSLIIMVTFVSARVLPVPRGSAGAAGFCRYRWVLPVPLGSAGTAGFCWYRWVLLVPLGSAGTAGFCWYRWVLLGTAGYRWVLLGTAGYRWVLLGTAGFCWVLLGTAGFCWCCWVLLNRDREGVAVHDFSSGMSRCLPMTAVTIIRAVLRDAGLLRITISTSRPRAFRKCIRRSTENPSSR